MGERNWLYFANDLKADILYVLACYRPPDNYLSVSGLEAAHKDVQHNTKHNPNSSIIVAGDFNAKGIQWDTPSITRILQEEHVQ